ncbi:MAG: hypothetical protein PHP02_00485 [Eubacteriales bacterium]|nr:hypothetical protein [Eubacteriales bacterium]
MNKEHQAVLSAIETLKALFILDVLIFILIFTDIAGKMKRNHRGMGMEVMARKLAINGLPGRWA